MEVVNQSSLSAGDGAPSTDRSVFVVDDHPAYQRALAGVIELTPGARLAGIASSGAEALEQVVAAGPDLVVMDVRLGDASGVDVTRQLVATSPGLRVLLISTAAENELPVGAGSCGAVGFVRKDRFGPAVLAEACGLTN
jgi:DNA-binding NarL/FixJ family response regulator